MGSAEALAGLSGAIIFWTFLEFLLLIATVVVGVFNFINIPVIGRPFGFLADAINSTVKKWLNARIKDTEHWAAQFFYDLVDFILIALALPVLVVEGVGKLIGYLWNEALMPRVHATTDPIRDTATDAHTKVVALTDTVADNFTTLENYAALHAGGAFKAAKDYTDDVIGGINTETLKGIDEVRSLASATFDEVESAVGHASGEAERVAGKTLDELAHLGTFVPGAGLIGLLAAIPLTHAVVQALEAETGLGNKECRDKVKQICTTDPAKWEHLLAGLAGLEVALHWQSMIELVGFGARTALEATHSVLGVSKAA